MSYAGTRSKADGLHFIPDEEIVARVRAGEIGQYEILVRRHDRRLHKLARGILRNEGEAEDAVQDVHLQVLTHLDQFAGRSSFLTWLTRIAINASLSRLRSQLRQRLWDISDEAQDDLGLILPFPGIDPEQQALETDLRRTLQRALDALPESYRVVFTMREVKELSTAECARRLGLTKECVKTRLHRAKSLLRGKLHRRVEAARPKHSQRARTYDCEPLRVLN